MAKRVSVLNGTNNSQDYDFTQWHSAQLPEGVLSSTGLQVQAQSVPDATVKISAGVCIIEVTRTADGKTFKIFGELTAEENLAIDDTGTNPTWIGAVVAVIDKSKVQDGSANAENGTGVFDLQYVAGANTSPLTDGAIDTAIGSSYEWIRLADITQDPTVASGDISDQRLIVGVQQVLTENDESIRAIDSSGVAQAVLKLLTSGDYPEFQIHPRTKAGRTIASDYDLIDKKYFDDNSASSVGAFGGSGDDGVLNVTSGTTNISIGTHQYSGITVSAGAVLSTTDASGVMKLLSSGEITLTGQMDFAGKITDTSPASAVTLVGGGTFTPTGVKSSAHGGGGGGGGESTGRTGGAGGAGNGGGAGGAGGSGTASGSGTGGAGGASSGGSATLGAGGNGITTGTAGAGGHCAGGGGSGGNGGAGGAGSPAGVGTSGTGHGGLGFGTDGGDKGNSAFEAGGGGAGGEGGNGGVDVIINCAGNFDGTSGEIDNSGSAGQDGGNGGVGGAGGGGGGGGKGGNAGRIRIAYGGSYNAPTFTQSAGAGGGGGTGFVGTYGSGVNGSAGSAGSAGANEATVPAPIY